MERQGLGWVFEGARCDADFLVHGHCEASREELEEDVIADYGSIFSRGQTDLGFWRPREVVVVGRIEWEKFAFVPWAECEIQCRVARVLSATAFS